MRKYILNILPFFIGIGCIIAFNLIGSDIAPDGTLNEPFYLIPLAYVFFIIGIIVILVKVIRNCIIKKQL